MLRTIEQLGTTIEELSKESVMAMITVMYYDSYSKTADDSIRSKRPATRETIIKYVKGTPIPETELQIDDAWLDRDGFLKQGYL
jgi:hypothetical protein